MTESDKYDVLEKIGHGSFGVIRKVRRKVDGMVLCRKEISYLKMSQKEREQLHAEFQILSVLRHPNIVGYYHREHLKLSQDLHLYMEYCGNGDLGRVIRDLALKNQYAEESFVWSIFAQLVTALYRCHYGVDPPEVGKNVLGLGTAAKPKAPAGGMTILHRDLKPENVFLNEDNSVKLGDFGLSKIMASHDFASTYVGTPFYMSPEICAAERYTLKSDIWSLGCIIYELCSREPPFNAKSHYQLVQKIKEGKLAPLPSVYSAELMAVIRDCLKVNPDRRPDTATLLNMPVFRLMRKEREVVELSKLLRVREDSVNKKMRDIEQKLGNVQSEQTHMRQEIEASLRREWEVKARLEIDRLVNEEIEQLQQRFEAEVAARVQEEMQKKTVSFGPVETQEFTSSLSKSDYPHSIGGHSTDADGDFPSTTDLTELSIPDSPEQTHHEIKKSTRTPFGRAQTMFAGPVGTPMDIEMASPSPIPLAALSLSPRRNAATKAPSSSAPDIFAGGNDDKFRDPEPLLCSDSEDDDEPPIPSPCRNPRSNKNPFGPKRPGLTTTKTAPMGQLKGNLMLNLNKPVPSLPPVAPRSDQQLASKPSNGALRERCNSPNRRLSKIPSASSLLPPLTTLASENSGLQRKPSTKEPASASDTSLNKVAAKNNIRGRTLVELQQARAGGRPLSAAAENGPNVSPKRTFKDRLAERNNAGFSEPVAIWDPEKDEMPSPFLVRKKPMARA
ncbi:kinase-like domain-containing protein [Xylariales sp. AK1849]|nr:kinase-like domain-containing protein [Xylariales sp. AK1849]